MKNWRALGVIISCFILAFVIFTGASLVGVAIGNQTFAIVLAVFAGIVGGLISAFGINSAGIILMHQALNQPPPAIGQALLGGMASFFKLLAIGLIFVVGWIAFTLIAALLIFLCKIPYVGPVLYGVVFPLLLICSGFAYVGTVFGGSLMAPAIWRGATIGEALKQFTAILRDHLVETIIRFLLLTILLMVVFGVIYGILAAGGLYTIGLSASIIGGGFGFGLHSLASFSGNGHAIAMSIGGGIIGALLSGSAFCAYILGMITIYLAVSRDIDTSAIDERTDQAQAQPRYTPPPTAPRVEPVAPTIAPVVAVAAVVPPRPVARTCPKCQSVVTDNDVFCAECGQRLS
jgi:MFS family permease